MDAHLEPTMLSEGADSEFHTAKEDTTPPPACTPNAGSSASSQYLSAHNATTTVSTPNSETVLLEREIEASKSHWSELSSKLDNLEIVEKKSNREIIEELQQVPKYQTWLNAEWDAWDVGSSRGSSKEFVLGRKLAEGGQAEIFEVENRCTKKIEPRYVLKVFKEGYSVRALQHQWPQGILECGFLIRMVVRAGMVLDDDRFACLLLRCHIDLRKLIDIAREEDSPLWEAKRRPFQDFRTYELRTPRYGLDPKPIFKQRCALNIMNHIAWGMLCLHNNDVLHRDLKASNILCTDDISNPHRRATLSGENQRREDRDDGRCIIIDVADFECSQGTVGTAFWRAPEILQQLKEAKGRNLQFAPAADVYSYAMTCYEIWTGRIPFEGYKNNDYDPVLRGVRPTLPDYVPTWVRNLLAKCWHQDPLERPSFSAIWQELRSRGTPHPHRNPVVLEAPDKSDVFVG